MRQKINASNLIRIYNRNGTVKRSNLRPERRNLTERKNQIWAQLSLQNFKRRIYQI